MNSRSYSGFTVNRVTPLPELEAELYQMTHDKTGAELVWIKRDEENKTFGIAFETLPWDDTGVFHILEHSVLCGSDKYPVKEPFVELMKSSMNTFLNALTFQDKTFYPISSRNDKDFVNLMRVYLDAVFCPLIYSKPEIFYQEGWHHEFDENGDASYKGVVLNEMKGAFASADETVSNALNRLLFPDSPYGFNSGGDPEKIPDLTYENFVDTHRRFYSPSNAYIFLDGDVDIEKTLGIINDEYLCKYEKTERIAPPDMQKAVSGEREDVYELAPGEDAQGKTRLAFGKVIGAFDDREKLVATQVLAEVLCGSNQSPLCRAVLAEGLAEEVNMSVIDGILQPWVMLDIKNLCDEDIEKVESLIKTQLCELAENGLDHAQLESVMAYTEFKMKERDFGHYPQGIIFGFTALESWLYGGDPAANFEVGDLFVQLREKMHEGYFEQLIRELFIDNPHSARVVLRPSYKAGEQRRAKEKKRIENELSGWNGDERRAAEEKQNRLLAWQESQDTPEVLDTIPQLEIEDIPDEPESIPCEEAEFAGIKVLKHELHTGGIVYVSLYFDADSCTEEELPYLSFAAGLFGETDTKQHSAEEIVNKTRLLCGDFEAHPSAYVVGSDPKNVAAKLCVRFSTLESNLEQAVKHVVELLTQSRFDNETAHDILRQAKMDSFQNIVMSGHSVGINRITAQSSPIGVIDDTTHGVSFYEWLKRTDDDWNFESLNERMNSLLKRIVVKAGLIVSISGADDEGLKSVAQIISDNIPQGERLPNAAIKPWGTRREGIAIPADIAFAVVGGNFNEIGGKYCGQIQLASQVISLAYLWNVIRVQGGAYGTGMLMRDNGLVACYSYRDPNGAQSIESYRDCAPFLREIAESGEDLTGFIIGAVANGSPLMTAKTKARVSDGFYFSKTTWETRCERRRQLLGATAQELVQIADIIGGTMDNGGICMIGGKEQLENCPGLENVITL